MPSLTARNKIDENSEIMIDGFFFDRTRSNWSVNSNVLDRISVLNSYNLISNLGWSVQPTFTLDVFEVFDKNLVDQGVENNRIGDRLC